jgi:membrane fusion protein (multidrug efflux system)
VIVELDTSSEQAQLQSAQASAELARSSLERVRALRGSNAIAPSELDSADARAKQASADVVRLRAEIAKRTIRAPFAGNLGIWQINLGQFLQSGAEVISVLALDPVYVDFTLPQQRLSQLHTNLAVRVTTDAFPNATFEGKLSAIDPGLDAMTRSVQLRATLANPKGQLRPGMFAHVEVVLPEANRVRVIPATAVLYAPYGDSVFVVQHAKQREPVARQRFIRIGERRGDYVVVTQGLDAGDNVVTAGAFKLRNGTPVVIDNTLVPKTSLSPTPNDN